PQIGRADLGDAPRGLARALVVAEEGPADVVGRAGRARVDVAESALAVGPLRARVAVPTRLALSAADIAPPAGSAADAEAVCGDAEVPLTHLLVVAVLFGDALEASAARIARALPHEAGARHRHVDAATFLAGGAQARQL